MSELNHLSCPFTWEMGKLCRTPDSLINRKESHAYDDSDEDDSGIPLLMMLYTVGKAYEYAENGCLEKAIKEIENSENLFNDLRKEVPDGLSMKAVDHIVIASKCFILEKMDKNDDVKKILETIPLCENSPELGTLHGCQSAIWHFYKFAGNEDAIENALTAIKLNPTNGLWHFLLAKCLRRIRRYVNYKSSPSRKEQMEFKKAFDMLKDPFIGIYVAQMYREMRDHKSAKIIYRTTFDMKPKSCAIYLKLALGFIRCKEADDARKCLEYVEARMPKNTRYLHYKGIYLHQIMRDYKGAMDHFEEAGNLLNFTSDLSFIKLKLYMNAGMYNPMTHLEIMLQRYEQFGGYRVQVIFLNMGTYYLNSKNDDKNACKYYLKAIEIDPRCKSIRNFHSDISKFQCNIFEILNDYIIPKLKKQKNLDDVEMIKKAQEYCTLYKTDELTSLEQQIRKVAV